MSDSLSLHRHISASMCFSHSRSCAFVHILCLACVFPCTFWLFGSAHSETSERWIFSNLSLSQLHRQDFERSRKKKIQIEGGGGVKDSVRVEQVSWWIYRTHCYCQYLSVYTEILFATPVCCHSVQWQFIISLITADCPSTETHRERERGRPVEDEEVGI